MRIAGRQPVHREIARYFMKSHRDWDNERARRQYLSRALSPQALPGSVWAPAEMPCVTPRWLSPVDDMLPVYSYAAIAPAPVPALATPPFRPTPLPAREVPPPDPYAAIMPPFAHAGLRYA